MNDSCSFEIIWSPKVLTLIIILLCIVQIIHITFSIYSYFFLRNKQFIPCSKGEYRGSDKLIENFNFS